MNKNNVDIVAVAVLLVVLALVGQARRVVEVREMPSRAVSLAISIRNRVIKVPTCTAHRISPINWSE